MFEKWIKEVPVIGFNSAKYDSNIMKVYIYVMLFKNMILYINNMIMIKKKNI
jgi:hypothetical protein